MKRILTTLIALSLVVACFCVPLVASAEYVGGSDSQPVSGEVVSSLFDYGLVYGYYTDASAEFVDWVALSTFEFTLADLAFSYEDVSITITTPTDDREFELHYYPTDPYRITTIPYWTLEENDPDISCVYSWRFDSPFVVPVRPEITPVAYCNLPRDGESSVEAYASYSYDYYDGYNWVHQSYIRPIEGVVGEATVSLFPENAETRLLRNLNTSIVFDDSVGDSSTLGVWAYSMPYFLGNKNNNIYYDDPVTYAIEQYGVIDGSTISWTGFIGNALGGVFDAPLFKIDEFEFTLGGLLGVCVGLGVLMVVLKKFAGG